MDTRVGRRKICISRVFWYSSQRVRIWKSNIHQVVLRWSITIVMCKYYIHWSMSIGSLLTMIWTSSYYRIIVIARATVIIRTMWFFYNTFQRSSKRSPWIPDPTTRSSVPMFVRCLSVRAWKALAIRCTERSMLQQQHHRAQRATIHKSLSYNYLQQLVATQFFVPGSQQSVHAGYARRSTPAKHPDIRKRGLQRCERPTR